MLSGKTAIITGASRGIGAQIARSFALNGASVALIYNGNTQKAQEVKKEITEASSVKSEIYQCNVSDYETCQKTVLKIIEDFGTVDILVNNAGITKDGLIMTMAESDFEDVIDVNLKGCFNMIKALSRTFVKKKRGKIINISSVSGLFGLPGQANYSASKAGIIGLTKAVAKELGGKNVNCNAICPGFIETDMTKDLNTAEFMKSIPLKRLGKTEDVASLAIFLASEMSDYITGEVIKVDGGIAM